MQRNTGASNWGLTRCERQAKRSQGRRIFLWAFVIICTLCMLFLGRGLLSAIPPGAAAHTRSSTDVVENPRKNAPATAKEYGDEQAWSLILVNKQNPIPAEYDVELKHLSNGQSVNVQIYPSLQKMFDAARADGVYPIVASGYRTTKKQQKIMDKKIAEYEAKGYSSVQAQAEAEVWVAKPGTSEHQLGIAVDINADGIRSTDSEVYEWLDENGYRFGFIRRYPPDKTKITGVSNEPWHYRYVGIAAATEIHRQNLCLEEYLNTKK